MKDLEQKLKDRIRLDVERAIAEKNPNSQDFQALNDDITRAETRRFYLNYFAAVNRTYGRVNSTVASNYGGYDRKNFTRTIRNDGFDIDELMEASKELIEPEIPEDILEKGITYFRREILTPSIMSPYLSSLLKRHSGNISAATREYGIDRSNFRRLLKQYNLA